MNKKFRITAVVYEAVVKSVIETVPKCQILEQPQFLLQFFD